MATKTHGIYVPGAQGGPQLIATPTLVMGFDLARSGRSRIFHTDAGSRVLPRPASLRSGSLQFGFIGADAASQSRALEESVATGIVHVIYTLPSGGGSYSWSVEGIYWALAEGGEIRRTLDESRAAWVVTIGVQEVDLA